MSDYDLLLVPDESRPALSDEWVAEIERRSAEYDAGSVPPIPWEKIRAGVFAAVEWWIMTTFGRITPILRIFDEAKAKEFYVDFLGFKVDWEHRFADDLPLYMQVSKDDCIIHLSGHFGDCCPGSAVRIETTELEAYHQELFAKRYKHARPGIERQPWDRLEMCITDPFGNRLIFSSLIDE